MAYSTVEDYQARLQALESQNPVSPVTASTDMENAPNVLDKKRIRSGRVTKEII